MARPSQYPALWCDFNAGSWSGRPDDDCYYALDKERLKELSAKAGMKVFLYQDDSADGREIVGIDGELIDDRGNLIAKPTAGAFYHGPRFW